MTCESARAQLTAYLDGELAGDRGSALRGHLRECDACRRAASDEAAIRDGLRSLPPLDPPASLWAGVQARLAQEEVADAKRPAWRRALARWTPRAPQLGIAGLAIAAAIIILVIKLRPEQESTPQQTAWPTPPALPQIKPAPVPETKPQGDVTAELAAEPAKQTQDYAQAARELEDLAKDARGKWSAEQQQQFDAQIATLHGDVDRAKDERVRQRAYRSLIRYLQRAAVRDDVALAGGLP